MNLIDLFILLLIVVLICVLFKNRKYLFHDSPKTILDYIRREGKGAFLEPECAYIGNDENAPIPALPNGKHCSVMCLKLDDGGFTRVCEQHEKYEKESNKVGADGPFCAHYPACKNHTTVKNIGPPVSYNAKCSSCSNGCDCAPNYTKLVGVSPA
jgi:hypothetical protein